MGAAAVQDTAVLSSTAAADAAGASTEAQQRPQQSKDVSERTISSRGVTANPPPVPQGDSGGIVQPLQLRYAVSADKGTRTTMEDVHVCIEPQLDNSDNKDR